MEILPDNSQTQTGRIVFFPGFQVFQAAIRDREEVIKGIVAPSAWLWSVLKRLKICQSIWRWKQVLCVFWIWVIVRLK